MFKKNSIIFQITLVLIVMAVPAVADQKFIRVDDLKGEVEQELHKDWSYLNAYTHIIYKPGKEPACKVIVEKPIDSISPALWMTTIDGKILEEVEVHFVSQGEFPKIYFISLMKVVKIKRLKSLEADDEEGGDITEDRIVLLPESMKLTYARFDTEGNQLSSIVAELNCSN